MKKILLIIILLFAFKVHAFDITSKEVILYNLDNNEVLYEKDANEKTQIASLTKIMTAIVTLDNVPDLNKRVIVTKKDLQNLEENNLATAGFTLGEVVSYKDLLYALLLPSGADAAQILANNISDDFVSLMNEKAKELKLTNTHFQNPIGLDNSENYSTASDVAKMFKYALKNKEFKEIIQTSTYTSSNGKIFSSSIFKASKKYNIDAPYILGGKTGTTDGAGLCLASIAKANDVNYMLITIGSTYDKKSPHHLIDSKEIYDYYISNYSNQIIAKKTDKVYKIKTKYSSEKYYYVTPNEDIKKYLPNDYNKNDITYKFKGLKEITPFTKENTKIGKLEVYYQDKLINTQTIYLNKKIDFSLINFIKENLLIIISVVVIIILIIKKLVL